MRLSEFAAAVGSAVALVGFAGAANASATIDLIWADTGTDRITNVNTSSAITLQVILTGGPNGSRGARVSVDYGAALGTLSVLGFASTPGGPLTLTGFPPIDTGSRVEGIIAFALPPMLGTGLAAGQSHQLGTVTFHKSAFLIGTFEIRSDANSEGDGVLDFGGGDITATTTFNSALLINLADFDADGLLDNIDNCSERANVFQDDTDGDDCGNLCDADYNQDGIVGWADFGWFSRSFGTNDEVHCHRDGWIPGCTVGFGDFGFFGANFQTTPGPSGTTAGTIACPL